MNYYYNELLQGITICINEKVCNFQFKKLPHNRCTIAFCDDTWKEFNDDELYAIMDFLLAQKDIQLLMERINHGQYTD